MRVVHTLHIVLIGEMFFPNTCSPVQADDHGEGHSGDVIHVYKPTIKQVDEFGIKPFKLKKAGPLKSEAVMQAALIKRT